MASKRPAFRENIHRLFDEAQAVDLGPGIVSLIESKEIHAQIREIPMDKILPNPAQPRLSYEEDSLTELADSIREHGVLQPILVRPVGSQYELIAGERRWRASRMAQRETIPAIVAEFDDQTALEVSIIENLQREDVSPLEEAAMFRKMMDLGYSLRQLAQKIGKDKGYVENRMRLAEAPPEIRELVSVRKDTISHAYELMKVRDERTRRRLAKKVAAGELTLSSCGPSSVLRRAETSDEPKRRARTVAGEVAVAKAARATDDALMTNRGKLAEAIEELVDLLRRPELIEQIPDTNRDNLARYLTVTKLKLENAIAIIRASREAALLGRVAHHLAVVDQEVDQPLARLRVDLPQAGDRLRQLEDRRGQRAAGVDADDVVRAPPDQEGALEATLVQARKRGRRQRWRCRPPALGEVDEQVSRPAVDLLVRWSSTMSR